MGIFDDLKKMFGIASSGEKEEDWSDLSELSEQIRRRNAEQAKKITSTASGREPPNPIPQVEDSRHQKFAEKYAWFKGPKRAAQYILGTDWDDQELEQLVEWATYTYSDEDVDELVKQLPDALSSPSPFIDRRLAAAWIISRRVPDEEIAPPTRRVIHQLIRANPTSEHVPAITSDLDVAVEELYDVSRFSRELLAVPHVILTDPRLREEAIEAALNEEARYLERYWGLGQEFVDEVARRAIDQGRKPTRFVVEMLARSRVANRFDHLFHGFVSATDPWDRQQAEQHVAEFRDKALARAIELLAHDRAKERRIGLHLVRLVDHIPAETRRELASIAEDSDDVRVRVELMERTSGAVT